MVINNIRVNQVNELVNWMETLLPKGFPQDHVELFKSMVASFLMDEDNYDEVLEEMNVSVEDAEEIVEMFAAMYRDAMLQALMEMEEALTIGMLDELAVIGEIIMQACEDSEAQIGENGSVVVIILDDDEELPFDYNELDDDIEFGDYEFDEFDEFEDESNEPDSPKDWFVPDEPEGEEELPNGWEYPEETEE